MSSPRPDVCRSIDWIGATKVVALGLVASAEAKALADHVPLSPQTLVVWLDFAVNPKALVWRPTSDINS
ncbi:hypothetical protein Syun_028489 [Stephania yunnanensis]|uniref:Uncharacterized protein n=1 Tax=Stephania yunnanensis TaxID=152371 RepID=A0AAP0EPU2_9MAGN